MKKHFGFAKINLKKKLLSKNYVRQLVSLFILSLIMSLKYLQTTARDTTMKLKSRVYVEKQNRKLN